MVSTRGSARSDDVEEASAVRTRMEVDARRQQLIRRGLELFATRAYDEVSIDDLARGLGISKGLLYHYFPTKRDFYAAVIEAAANEILERTQPDVSLAPLDRLASGLKAYLEYVEQRADAYVALMRGGIGSDREVAHILEKTRMQLVTRILNAMGATSPIPRLRILLRAWIGFVEAASLDWLAQRDMPRDDLVAMLVELFPAIVATGLGMPIDSLVLP